MSFTPEPSAYRDLLSGEITTDEFLAVHEEREWQGPTRWTYEDWFDGASAWAANQDDLDLMPFQIQEFARVAAQVYEANNILPTSFREAWDRFLSGLSGGPHHVALDGYDLELWRQHQLLRDCDAMRSAAAARGIEEPELGKIMSLWRPWAEDAMDTHPETIEDFLNEWISGAITVSPHHIPLDPQNELEREAERVRVLNMDCYSSLRNGPFAREIPDLAKCERPSFPEKKRRSWFMR